jgi:hypothetical protein
LPLIEIQGSCRKTLPPAQTPVRLGCGWRKIRKAPLVKDRPTWNSCMARPTSVEQFTRRSQRLWRKPYRQAQRFAAELTFSGQNGIRGLLDKLSDNPGNDRQADQLDSQLQATDSQRHTPSCADKVANLRLSSLDDILELQPSAEPSIFQLKYARASLAKLNGCTRVQTADRAIHPWTSIKGPDAEHGPFHKVILTASKPSGPSVTGK